MKKADITSVLKKGKKEDLGSYRTHLFSASCESLGKLFLSSVIFNYI